MRISNGRCGAFVFSKLIVTLVIVSIGYVVYHFALGLWEASKGGTLITSTFVKDRSQGDEALRAGIVEAFRQELKIEVNPEAIQILRPEDGSTVKFIVPFEHPVRVPGTDYGFNYSFTSEIEEPIKVSNPFR